MGCRAPPEGDVLRGSRRGLASTHCCTPTESASSVASSWTVTSFVREKRRHVRRARRTSANSPLVAGGRETCGRAAIALRRWRHRHAIGLQPRLPCRLGRRPELDVFGCGVEKPRRGIPAVEGVHRPDAGVRRPIRPFEQASRDETFQETLQWRGRQAKGHRNLIAAPPFRAAIEEPAEIGGERDASPGRVVVRDQAVLMPIENEVAGPAGTG